MLPHPSYFLPALTNERLSIVAGILLTEYNKTLDDLSSDADDNYTRGCASFGRQKNRIQQLAMKKVYPWLDTMNSTYDLVLLIGGIPCRFANDDPSNPKKKAVLTANGYQMSFFDEIESNEAPCRFCFIIVAAKSDDEEPQVVFIGYDAYDVPKCQWESGTIRTLHNAKPADVPSAVDIGKPPVKPKKSDSASDGEANQS